MRDWPYDKDTLEEPVGNLHGDIKDKAKHMRDKIRKRKRKQGKTYDRERMVLFARTKHYKFKFQKKAHSAGLTSHFFERGKLYALLLHKKNVIKSKKT